MGYFAIPQAGSGGSSAGIVGGAAVVDFGAEGVDAAVVVTGQAGITADSTVNAWVALRATPQHSVDEHRVEPLYVTVGSIVPGVGFTIYVQASRPTYGTWSLSWSWL